jgi:tetratricopeptide (TPR) repeat protein
MDGRSSRWKRRVALYLVSVVVVAGFVFAGWFYEAPPDYDAQQSRVFELVGQGNHDEARQLFATMKARMPTDVRVPMLRAWMEDGLGHPDVARAAYYEALPLCINDAQRVEIILALADLSRRQGKVDEALEYVADVAETFGETETSHHVRTLCFIDKGHWKNALGEIERLAEMNPVSQHAKRLRMFVRRHQEAQAAPETPQGAKGTDG